MPTASEDFGELREFSHIIPSLRFVPITGAGGPGVPTPVPGAQRNDVLLGVWDPTSDANLFADATLADGEITFATFDQTGIVMVVVFFDENGVLEY